MKIFNKAMNGDGWFHNLQWIICDFLFWCHIINEASWYHQDLLVRYYRKRG